MNAGTESAVRHALSLAAMYQRDGCALDAARQRDIVAEVRVAADKKEARRRRNAALRNAFEQMGKRTPIPLFYEQVRDFERRLWPRLQADAGIPEAMPALHRAFFEAYAAAAAGGLVMPDEHQMRKIVK